MNELDEVIGEFLVESHENLDRLDQDLVALEDNPGDRQLLGGIFRTIHTIKGTCGFLGYSKLEALTHAGENLLSKLRDGALELNPPITSALLAMVDSVRQMLSAIEADGTEGEGDYSALTATLHELLENGGTAESSVAAPAPSTEATQETTDQPPVEAPPAATPVEPAPTAAEPEPPSVPPVAKPEESATPAAKAPAETATGHGPSAADTTIRVDVSLLDTLMNLVGELVLARNQIVQVTTAYGEADLTAAAQRLNLITTELQEGVMKTRMQPIGNVLSKFPRVVRDIAVQLGKQVRMDIEGKETELDKTINEAIKDPLTHLVRNSVDHGIEMPQDRLAKGKPAEGHVTLRAFHEGGHVNIEIQDDGAGMDGEKLKRKALEKGLITQAQADRMGERDALQMIFMPGFSTAEKVSNISGRGVGMDVVKTNIESIGGSVDITTVLGEGTTFKIKIPLTLAIIPALIVTTSGDRYAIPQVSLLELMRLEGEQAHKGIEMIHGAPILRLRGQLLPLCHLGHELWDNSSEPWHGPTDDENVINIVVLQADGRQFGLVVDEINDTQEIVVKPLDQQIKGTTALAGATIMGDGHVALILDVLGLAQKAHVISEARDKALAEAEAAARLNAQAVNLTETLLLVQVGDRRLAVPLSLVARLEEFPRTQVENANGRTVVQYRNEIMPLVDIAYAIGANPQAYYDEDNDNLHVIVYTSNGRSMGLMVDSILDIVDEPITTGEAQDGTGVRGSAVVQGKVTDIVDVIELVRSIDPTFFVGTESAEAGY